MATVTTSTQLGPFSSGKIIVGPEDHGRAMGFEAFLDAEVREGWLYELARGVVVVTEVPRPEHGEIIWRITELLILYDVANRGIIKYRAGGSECRIRLPEMRSDRHPNQAVYLRPRPEGRRVWTRWIPEIVVEVVSESGEDRDYVEKREEYLVAGVREYWILDPKRRRMLVLVRLGDVWEEILLGEDGVHRTGLLPGLEARVGDLLGPAVEPAAD